MPEYKVSMRVTQMQIIHVSASSEEEAREKAENWNIGEDEPQTAETVDWEVESVEEA